MARRDRDPQMSSEQRRERMRAAVELYRANVAPANIGERLGLTARTIRKLLIEAGEVVGNESSVKHEVDRMWSTDDEHRRREQIAERASRGARETLMALQFPPLFTDR